MKVILLAGGLGTRISEETSDKPKPMVRIANKPIIWHLMNIFAQQGFQEFILATGYKNEVIHDWVDNELKEDWSVVPLFTGLNTQTGGRIRQCMNFIGDERVIATYGDGLGNVSIKNLLEFHKHAGTISTVTAVRPPARFGVIKSQNGLVTHFGEKNQVDAGWINGGFFVLDPEVRNYISEDSEPFEGIAMPKLVEKRQLSVFHHHDFWQPMDTLRERTELESLASQNPPPWLKV